MTNLYDIVERLGGEVSNGGRCALVPGPGHSRHDRSLSLRLSDIADRVVFYSHAGDSTRSVMDYLGIEARHGDARMAKADLARMARARAEAARKLAAEDNAFCSEIWSGTLPIEGTAAEAYLWSRGLILDRCEALRFHPSAPRAKPRLDGQPGPPAPHPAMVALVSAATGAPVAIHATYVLPDGTGKAFGSRSRLMFGPTRGGAVRLSPVGAGGTLAVSEGIETAAAFAQLAGMPTWACLSTSGIANFEIPAGVRSLVIAADNDANGAGVRAALALAERACKRCDVEIKPPPSIGDWADVATAAT